MRSVVQATRLDLLDEMEDEVEIFEDVRLPSFEVSRVVNILSYGLFIIPAALLILGALIAATSPGGFFRWFDIALIIGGLTAWALAFFTHHLGTAALDWAIMRPEADIRDVERLVLEKTFGFQEFFIERLFRPVQSMAGIVSLIGLAFFAVSFIVGRP